MKDKFATYVIIVTLKERLLLHIFYVLVKWAWRGAPMYPHSRDYTVVCHFNFRLN